MLYKYRAKKGVNEITEGTINAQSEKEAVEKISQMGYLPLHIEKASQFDKSQTFPVKLLGRITSAEITVFSRQLASLLKSGVPILRAIDIISEQSANANFKNTLNNIRGAIKDGAFFSSVLAQYPQVFSSLYIAMVKTGENTGALPEVLLRISEYRAKEEEMFSRFRLALAYPLLMAVVGLATVIFMLVFVMPRLTRIFVDMGQDLPLATRVLISISRNLQQWWFLIVIIIAAVILSVKKQAQTQAGRLFFSALKLKFPVLGGFILKAELARFSRTLELLVKSGIPILKAIDIAIPVLQNVIIKEQLIRSYKELEQGGSFGKSLKNSKVLPLFMSNLLIVGEESGKLDEVLGEIAGSYERDTDDALKIMASLLEPLLILAMGLIVGFIVVAMLLPIFEISPMR